MVLWLYRRFDLFQNVRGSNIVTWSITWHKIWLGQVSEISGFEKQYLSRFTELNSLSRAELAGFLAECHVEFILIHPFREGNGRLSRLLFDVLAVQAGAGVLDYSLWD